MRGFKPLQFLPLYQEEEEGLTKLELCFRLWWGGRLTRMSSRDWFKHKDYILLWTPPPAVSEA